MDFIDKALDGQKARPGAEKKTRAEVEYIEKLDHEIREQVDALISEMVLPVLLLAKKSFERHGIKVEVDLETSTAIDSEKRHAKGVKLQLAKGLDRKAAVPILTGSSIAFSASPPYSTTIAIVAYGTKNDAIFSERFEMAEMNENLVVAFLKRFVEEVIE